MNLESIFALKQAPVSFTPHPAVQKEVVLSSCWAETEVQQSEWKDSLNQFVESIVMKMLPVYLNTNLDVTAEFPGLYKVMNESHWNQWQSAFWFLQRHSEVEKIALLDSLTVKMLNNPFPQVEDDRLYVADELNDFGSLAVNNMGISAVKDFVELNPALQVLNPAVVVGNREIVLEFLGLFLTLRQQLDEETINPYTEKILFNYVLYRYFINRTIHGRLVSSIMEFKQFDSPAWFQFD